jgi:plastocyanin
MARKALALTLLAAVAAAVLAAGALARRSAAPTIVGTVGPGFTITLKKNGVVVKKLTHGTYTLVIKDRSSIHAWSLDGPNGFEKDYTKVPFIGTRTFTVTLRAGKYKYYCPPHEASMFGRFTVT